MKYGAVRKFSRKFNINVIRIENCGRLSSWLLTSSLDELNLEIVVLQAVRAGFEPDHSATLPLVLSQIFQTTQSLPIYKTPLSESGYRRRATLW